MARKKSVSGKWKLDLPIFILDKLTINDGKHKA